MRYRYQFMREAPEELDREIAHSERSWGKAHAGAYRRELPAVVRKIAQNPKIYAEKPDLGEGLRSVRHKG
jgi:plasmid stabilization system protein ParE